MEAKKALPKGWNWARLEEVCSPDRKIIKPSSLDAKSLTYYGLDNIESETGKIKAPSTKQNEDKGRSATFLFDSRHVLYGKLRPYLNKVALPKNPGRCTTELIPLMPCSNITRTFLSWALRRPEIVDFAMQGKTGSRMPRADMNSLLTFLIPVPPITEQKRIAAILKEKMVSVENARAAAETRLEAIKALPTAFLRQVFPQPDQTLPNGWRWMKLGDAGAYWNGRAFKPEEWREEGVPIVRIENLNTPEAPCNYFKGDVLSRHLIKDGDLLVSWSASLDAYIWNRGTAILNQHIFKVEENVKIIDKQFFYFALRYVMRKIRENVHGATMKHITKPEFEKIEIPVPSLAKQRQIAAILKEQTKIAEKTRYATEVQLKTINAIPVALLRKAFNGEL